MENNLKEKLIDNCIELLECCEFSNAKQSTILEILSILSYYELDF
jgi:hypothetical protein